jgi:GAF domain-containing protein
VHPPPALATPRRRGPNEDLISDLFEELHQLHFMPDLIAGAEYVVGVLASVMPCEGLVVHVFDINTRNFVVVRAIGPRSNEVLLHKTPDTFAHFREAFRRGRALAFTPEAGDERVQRELWDRLGVEIQAGLCGAVQQAGRYLGVIELANPSGGPPFHVGELNALDYICEQFADFIAQKPIILDADAVIPRQ